MLRSKEHSTHSKSLNHFRRFAWFNLAFCIAVILWGAYVRASGSGAGCGSHWPLCNGEILPRPQRFQTYVELTHRLSSGLTLLFVTVLFVWSRKIYPKGFHRKIALYTFLAMIMEALLGAMLVLLRLVEHDQSIDRAVSIALHLLNTLFLLAGLTITALATFFEKPRFHPVRKEDKKWLWSLLFGFAFLGAFGALAALGDTLFPPSSHFPSEGRLHFLERIRIIHPLLAILWYGGIWIWITNVMSENKKLLRCGIWLLLAGAGNIIIGLVNVLLLAPVPLQILHLFFADLVWVLFICFAFSHSSR